MPSLSPASRLLRRLGLLALPLLLLSCDSNDSGDESLQPGTFTVTVSGHFTDTFSGQAVFETGTDEDGQEYFFLQMTSGTAQGAKTAMIVRPGGQSATGQHDFIDLRTGQLPEGRYAGFVARESNTDEYVLVSTAGNINISASTDSHFAGTFNFPAEGYRTLNQVTAPLVGFTVSGQFDAVESPVPIVFPEL